MKLKLNFTKIHVRCLLSSYSCIIYIDKMYIIYVNKKLQIRIYMYIYVNKKLKGRRKEKVELFVI